MGWSWLTLIPVFIHSPLTPPSPAQPTRAAAILGEFLEFEAPHTLSAFALPSSLLWPPRATLKFERKVGLEVEKTLRGQLTELWIYDWWQTTGEGDEGASAALLYFFVVLLLVLKCGVQRPACLRPPTLHLRVCNRANKRTSWFQLSTQMQLQKSPNPTPRTLPQKTIAKPFPCSTLTPTLRYHDNNHALT